MLVCPEGYASTHSRKGDTIYLLVFFHMNIYLWFKLVWTLLIDCEIIKKTF